MSNINDKLSEVWIKENHPENGLFRVYWKDIIDNYDGGATLDLDEGEGLRYEWYYKDGERADGPSYAWWPSGNIKQIRSYKDGKCDGLWIDWHDNGQKSSEKTYKDDKYDGLFTQWFENGQKKSEGTYKDAEKIKETFWYENGQEIPIFRKIDIETHSYCNRTCDFCSDYIYPRQFMKEMDKGVFSKIIDELVELGYDRYIFLFRYNEPLSNLPNINRCAAEVRKKLPKVKIGINTNGDYYRKGGRDGTEMADMIQKDIDADYLTIMDYDDKFEEFWDEDEDGGVRTMKFDSIGNMCDRGGTLKGKGYFDDPYNTDELRTEACYEPERVLAIDYLGNITFCCNFRIENPAHKDFIFGNIEDISIVEAYNRATEFRESVAKSIFPDPCKYCQMKPGRFSRDNPSIGNNMETYE